MLTEFTTFEGYVGLSVWSGAFLVAAGYGAFRFARLSLTEAAPRAIEDGRALYGELAGPVHDWLSERRNACGRAILLHNELR